MLMLSDYFKGLSSVLVAYSGGLDSAVLAKAAYDALGVKAVAVTFDTPTIARHELADAVETAKNIGIQHVIEEYRELSDEGFRSNPPDRCYHCKKMMADMLLKLAAARGLKCVVEGTTIDELEGHRPGYKAVQDAGVRSPYVELGLSKDDVRAYAREYGLNQDQPSTTCLASRIPVGTEVTDELLAKIEAAEDYLRCLGLTQVRVRVEGEDARIEVCREDFGLVVGHSGEIVEELPFRRVTLDLRGYS
jgi:uncharacterized protein